MRSSHSSLDVRDVWATRSCSARGVTRPAATPSSASRAGDGAWSSCTSTARSAPWVRMWRVNARVSMPAIPGTFQRRRYSSSDASLEWWLGDGHAQRTMSARAHGRADSASASRDRKSARLNSSHVKISYAAFCLKKETSLDLLVLGACKWREDEADADVNRDV